MLLLLVKLLLEVEIVKAYARYRLIQEVPVESDKTICVSWRNPTRHG